MPGRGGITRGRGDAEMTFGPGAEGVEAQAARRLTPSQFAELESSSLLGVSATAPEASGVSGGSAGLQTTSDSVGASTFKRRLVPRHRRAVSEFFKPDR